MAALPISERPESDGPSARASDARVPVARVLVLPAAIELEVRANETILAAARRLGVDWPSRCGGNAECSTCNVRIVEAEPEQDPPRAREASTLERYALLADARLACQLRPRRNLKVFKPTVAGRPNENRRGDSHEHSE